MELSIDEQTLIVGYRGLDEGGRKELLRLASKLLRLEESPDTFVASGQCRLERLQERPETVAEPIFTE